MAEKNIKFRLYQRVETLFAGLLAGVFAFRHIRHLAGTRLFIPYYHLISDRPHIPHTQWLFQHRTPGQFEADIDFFLKHFKPVEPADLLESIRSGRPISEPSFIITFDDGYREAYETAAPILEKRGLGAVFFLTTGFLDNRSISPRHKASIVLSKIDQNGNGWAAFDRVAKRGRLKTLPPPKAMKILAEEDAAAFMQIADALDIDFDDYLGDRKPFMTEADAKDLIRRGFALGAHSISHPRYAELPLTEMVRQTLASVQTVKETFSIDYRFFSFPYSDYRVPTAFYDRLKNDVDLFFGTSGFMVDDIETSIQRFPMENGGHSAEKNLSGQMIKKYLRTLAGINVIKRTEV